jgi:hypothetical protein
MKVTVTQDEGKVTFKSLAVGDTFSAERTGSDLWMKMNKLQASSGTVYDCVNLNRGDFGCGGGDQRYYRVDAEVVVKGVK